MNRRLKQVASPWRSLWIVNQRKIARDVLLRRLGVERSYRPAALFRHPDWNFDDPLKLAVAYALRRRPDFTFLQVGAFDGRTDDPIYPLVEEFGIRGIVVEPQPEMLETLRASYAEYPQVVVVNAAIADEEGTREFYGTKGGPSRKASFFRSNLLKHGVRPADIVAQTVRCTTIGNLMRGQGFERRDLIQIDAEGFDAAIVRTIDFQAVQPSIVRFEHVHLSETDCDRCVELLAHHGFRFIGQRRDIIALRAL